MTSKLKFRLGLFLAAFGVVLGLYFYRLVRLQVVNAKDPAYAVGTYSYSVRVTAARGEILDQNGNVLVSNRASYNLIIVNYALFTADNPNEYLRQLVQLCRELDIEFIDHLPVTREKPYEYVFEGFNETWNSYFRQFLRQNEWDPDISAAQLIKLMRTRFHIPNNWTDEDIRGVLGLRYELDLRNYTSLPAYTLRTDVDAEELSELMELNIPGMQVQSSTVREYNTNYAAHILGRTAAMSPEEWAIYKDKGYSMDAFVGKEGMEKAFEPYLHGQDGTLRITVDREGNVISRYYKELPVAGKNVVTTIDIGLQMTAETALERFILNLRESGVTDGSDAEGGAVVVMDIKTGAVLASASYPTFQPASFSKDYNKLLEEPFSPLLNRALMQVYPPGSTYKMCTAIAALNDGVITRNTLIEDEGVYTRFASDDQEKNYTPVCYLWTSSRATHGVINCAQALAVSCNYFFYETGFHTGWRRMDQTAKALGLGEHTGVELPEAKGYRANPDSKKALYKDPNMQVFTDGDTISMAIGQSENRFTPLQMAVYTAALANRGVRYKATILERVISADYQDLLYQMEPVQEAILPITDEAYEVYTQGMRMAVTLNRGGTLVGTANKVFGDYPIKVCAKTGTAQHGGEGSDNASLVCYAPEDNPQIAIAIYVEKGGHGGNLGNIATEIFDVYFDQNYTNDTVWPENSVN